MVDLSLVKPNNLWYIIGLIVTDGNLANDGRHINITSKDTGFLEEIRKSLSIKNKITIKSRDKEKEKKYYFLQFGDIKFYKFLTKIGLTAKKSLTLKEIEVPQQYFVDFLRGIIDGDGSISSWVHNTNGNIQWSLRIISAAPIFVNWLKKEIEDYFNVKGKIYGYKHKDKKNFLYIIKFGKFAAKVVLKKCYYRNCLSLNRKFDEAKKCLLTTDRMKKYGNVVASLGAETGRQPRLKIE